MYLPYPFEIETRSEFSNLNANILTLNFLFANIENHFTAIDAFLGKGITVIEGKHTFTGTVIKVVAGTVGFQVIVHGNLHKLNKNTNRRYSKQCRALFCDTQCGLDILQHNHTAFVAEVREMSIILQDTLPKKYWQGGHVLFVDGKSLEIRGINAKELLFFERPSVNVEDSVTVVASCSKTLEVCGDVYHNVVNFRGEPFILRSGEKPYNE